MPTLSCLVALLCTLVLLTECKRKLLPWLPPLLRSRSLLLQKGNTLSGLVAPSWLLFLPSNKCGSPSKNMMNVVPPLSTGNAFKLLNLTNGTYHIIVIHSRAFVLILCSLDIRINIELHTIKFISLLLKGVLSLTISKQIIFILCEMYQICTSSCYIMEILISNSGYQYCFKLWWRPCKANTGRADNVRGWFCSRNIFKSELL